MKTTDLTRRLRTDAPILRDWWSAGRTGDVSLNTIAMLEDAANRIEALEQALRDTRYGGAPYNSRRYDEITMLLSTQDQHSGKQE